MKEGKDRPVIVIPTNRPEQFSYWLNSWINELEGCHLIVIEDIKKKTIDRMFKERTENLKRCTRDNNFKLKFTYEVFDWTDIDKDLGKDAWIIPRKTDCIRSYGFLKALEHEPLFILTLDDDTAPYGSTIQDHYNALFKTSSLSHKYYNTMRFVEPRGSFTNIMDMLDGVDISHGVWYGTPDLDAKTQLDGYVNSDKYSFNKGIIPVGSYYSMCGMNVAFKPRVTPFLYFGLQGKDYPIDRCGDIWAGYYASQNNVISVTGYAAVNHLRASNAWTNLKKEINADELGHQFRTFFCEEPTFEIKELEHKDYWFKLKDAYNIWERLCNERLTR